MYIKIGEKYAYKEYIDENCYFRYVIEPIETNLCKLRIDVFNYEKLENGEEEIIDSEWLCNCEAKIDINENQVAKARMLGLSVFKKDKCQEFIVVNKYKRAEAEDYEMGFSLTDVENLFDKLGITDYTDSYVNMLGITIYTGCK